MGSSTENSAYGVTRNPWNPERIPGGSSGGSAAAVAARLVPLALGSDTGGSIRQPAALCGVTGFKPTYGRVSRYGLLAFASSLDQIGPIAACVEDVALATSVLAGHDPRDATSANAPVPDFAGAVSEGSLTGLRVGVPRALISNGVEPDVLKAVEAALEVLAGRGAKLVDVDLPHSRHGIAAYYLIATAEASSNLARYDGVRYGVRSRADRTLLEMYEHTRGQGFGRRGQAPDHARNLRPQRRVLRRLLSQGPAGAHADQPRLRRGVRAGRRDRAADEPDRRLPARRAHRRTRS